MTPAGFNPMQRKCTCRCGRVPAGCFNVKLRPKIEVFADCFPGRNNFGDVDGLVERNGAFLLLEWKTPGARLKTAQAITYRAISRIPRSAALAFEGDAEAMTVSRVKVFQEGRESKWYRADLAQLKRWIKDWADAQWAPQQSASWRQALRGDSR
jgi:hypothetical protein